MADIDRIKRNIGKMIELGAPEADIDSYLAGEGVTVDQLKQPQAAAPQAAPAPGFIDHMTGAVTDIPGEIYAAGKSALSSIGENLNPFSDARRASLERQSKQPFFSADGMKEQLGRIGDVGAGIAAIPQVPMAPVTGTGRSVLGHTMAAVTPGMDYEEGKEAADKAMMGIRAAGVGPGGQMKAIPPKIPTAEEIKSAASAQYKSPEIASLELTPQSATLLSQKIEHDLVKNHAFRPTSSSAGGVFDEVKALSPSPGVQSVNAADLDNARKALGMLTKEVNTVGKPTPQATAAQIAIKHIDDYLDNISPRDVLAGDPAAAQGALKQARANWAAGSRAEEIDVRLSRAERQSAKSGSGSNIENARRQKIDQVPEYGLTAEEKVMRDRIVMGTPVRNALRKVGKLGVDGGLSLTIHGAAALGTGGTTLPLSAIGTGARKLGEMLTKAQIKKLNEMIRSRSPLAKSLPPQQMLPPSPLFGSLFPYGLPQGLPMMMGGVPARAEDQ